MANLHFDGFTAYQFREDLDGVYTREDDPDNLRINLTGGPNEQGAINLGGVNRTAESGFFIDLVAAHDHIYMGFWLTINDFDNTDDLFDMLVMWTQNTTTIRGSLHIGDDGSILVRRSNTGTLHFDSGNAATTIDGQTHFLARDTEYKIEVYIKFINTVGSLELRVNDDVWGRFTETLDFDGTIDQVHFKANDTGSGMDVDISDWYINDETGIAPNNTFLGSRWQVEVLRPTAEAAGIAFTPATGTDNSAMVDDAPRHDADATENHSTGDAQVDRFTTGNSLALQAVNSVSVVNVARHEGTAQNFRAKIFEGATGGDGADEALVGTFTAYRELFETNPDTSLQWTVTEIEASEFGYESRA